MSNIIWFRNDLRLEHNLALSEAMLSSDSLEAVYIFPEKNKFFVGEAAQWYLHQSLMHLEGRLLKLGITLNVFIGNAADIFSKYIEKNGKKTTIFCNKSFNPIQLEIDQDVTATLKQTNNLRYIGMDTVFDPNVIKTKANGFYKIFTPFSNTFSSLIFKKKFNFRSLNKTKKFTPVEKFTEISDLKLITNKSWSKKFTNFWEPGELNSINLMNEFLYKNIDQYSNNRDNILEQYTSKLSVSINFGEISIEYLFSEIIKSFNDATYECDTSRHDFYRQLIWREFAKYSMFYNQDSHLKSIYDYCDSEILWSGDDILFELWKRSKTGINIVDASMKQLWNEGWMPNRARMVSASFLTKNLGIHWNKGFKWFWNTLVDADLASNAMGWQWVSGTAPYSAQFSRIFNPHLQEKKFDPQNIYINKYLNRTNTIKPIVSVSSSSKEAKIRYRRIKLLQENQLRR